jgi:hypothetical protein
VIGLVLLGGVAEAQAPPSLSKLYEDATRARQAAQAVMLATDAGKAYLATVAVENGLKARIDAEAKASQ